VPDISQNANRGSHSQLKDWKYVRLVRKWRHYNYKMKKGEKRRWLKNVGGISLFSLGTKPLGLAHSPPASQAG